MNGNYVVYDKMNNGINKKNSKLSILVDVLRQLIKVFKKSLVRLDNVNPTNITHTSNSCMTKC